MKKITTAFALLSALVYLSCNKKSDDTPLTVNGYTLNGIAYRMDSMTVDATGTIRLRSSDNGGSSLTLQRLKPWPTMDGAYHYPPWLPDTDSNGVRISFKHDSSATEYYSVPPNISIPALVFKVDSGKRALYLPSNWLNDSRDLSLQITAKE